MDDIVQSDYLAYLRQTGNEAVAAQLTVANFICRLGRCLDEYLGGIQDGVQEIGTQLSYLSNVDRVLHVETGLTGDGAELQGIKEALETIGQCLGARE